MSEPSFELVNHSVDRIFPQTTDFDSQLEQCMYMTRISYRYEDRESKQTPREFVQGLINSNHMEPLEFVTIHAYFPLRERTAQWETLYNWLSARATTKCDAHVRRLPHSSVFVFTLRELVEGFSKLYKYEFDFESEAWKDFSRFIVDDEEFRDAINEEMDYDENFDYKSYIRLKWVMTTNKQIATSITRHRTLSKNWESTRHCNYGKERFGHIRICDPELYKAVQSSSTTPAQRDALNALGPWCKAIMDMYSVDPVEAAYMLPSNTAVTAGFAGFGDEIEKIITIRTTNICGVPHRDVISLMTKLKEHLAYVGRDFEMSCEEDEDCDSGETKEMSDAEIESALNSVLKDKLSENDIKNLVSAVRTTLASKESPKDEPKASPKEEPKEEFKFEGDSDTRILNTARGLVQMIAASSKLPRDKKASFMMNHPATHRFNAHIKYDEDEAMAARKLAQTAIDLGNLILLH